MRVRWAAPTAASRPPGLRPREGKGQSAKLGMDVAPVHAHPQTSPGARRVASRPSGEYARRSSGQPPTPRQLLGVKRRRRSHNGPRSIRIPPQVLEAIIDLEQKRERSGRPAMAYGDNLAELTKDTR